MVSQRRIASTAGALLLGGGFLWAVPVESATFRDLAVSRDQEAFEVRFEAVVAAPANRVFAILTDFDRLQRLNPAIVESRRLVPTPGNPVRVRTVLEGCVAFFCRRMRRVEVVRTSDQRLIRTRILPEDSDFRSGHSRWELAAVTDGTRLRYRASLVPDFWVPPVIGPWAIKRTLRRGLRTLVRRLERLAGQADVAWLGQIGHHGHKPGRVPLAGPRRQQWMTTAPKERDSKWIRSVAWDVSWQCLWP